MDVLTGHPVKVCLTSSRRVSLGLLALALLAYLLFHQVRPILPDGWFRASFPSFLVVLVMFGVVDLVPSIRFHGLALKAAITLSATLCLAFWFEGVVPMFHPASRSDPGDALAMMAGWTFYIATGIPWRAPRGPSAGRQGRLVRSGHP